MTHATTEANGDHGQVRIVYGKESLQVLVMSLDGKPMVAARLKLGNGDDGGPCLHCRQ